MPQLQYGETMIFSPCIEKYTAKLETIIDGRQCAVEVDCPEFYSDGEIIDELELQKVHMVQGNTELNNGWKLRIT